MNNKAVTTILIIAAMIILNSCKKETITKNTSFAFNSTESTKIVRQLFALAMPVGAKSFAFKNSEFECVIITKDSLSSPQTTTYNYGSGCADDAGVVRKGIITATYYNENIQEQGTVITLSFTNFFINNDEVRGTMSIENIGANGSGNWVIRYLANCQDFSPVNGETQIEANQYFEWVEGGNTPVYDDDVFSITGSCSATTISGNQAIVSIQQPLLAKTLPGCNEYFVQGVTLTQTTNESDRYLDYGNGECDNLAVQTVNGNSQTIVLE